MFVEPITSSTTFLHHSTWGNSLFASQNDFAQHESIEDGKSVVMSLGVHEKRQLRIAKELRARTVNKLWKITEELNILYRENWTVLADREMVKFQNELLTGKSIHKFKLNTFFVNVLLLFLKI